MKLNLCLTANTKVNSRRTIDLNTKAKTIRGFSGGIVVKNLPTNAGNMGSIPRLGRSPGKGNGYPLQYSWISLVAQLIKNLPAMQET